MNTSLTKALAAARQRGRNRAIAVFNQPDNVRLEDAAAYANIEPAIIDAARKRGKVYALVSPTRPRELRHPPGGKQLMLHAYRQAIPSRTSRRGQKPYKTWIWA